jgi:beta-glucanase (GH16 family)
VTQSEIIKPIVLDQWQEVTFDFYSDPWINLDSGSAPPTTRSDFNRIVIQVNGENNFDHVLAYLDDVEFDGTAGTGGPGPGTTPVYDYLVWSDEFDVDGPISTANWFHQTLLPLPDSWYNGEIQHYTDRVDNSYVDNGTLKIVAKSETFTDQGVTKGHTSARLNSKFAFTYGKIEVRAKLPSGAGTWPAIWMLGKNVNEDGAYWDNLGYGTTGWPNCGEIDIMEHWGINPNYVSSATHTPSSFGGTVNFGGQFVPTAISDFHVYTLEWYPTRLVFSVDGVVHYTYEPSTYDASTWPFNAEQYLLMNVAILPDISPSFSSSALEVDYVRVYQENPCGIPANPTTSGITSSSATLSWDAVPGAIGYQVTGGPTGAGSGQFKTTSTSRTINILDPSTSYEWQVRAYCDPELSSFSAAQSFSTPSARIGSGLRIAPNPSSSASSILLSKDDLSEYEVEVLDLNGRRVAFYRVDKNSDQLRLEGLEAGLYVLKLSSRSEQYQELLVVH